MSKLCHFGLHSAIWFRIFFFFLRVHLKVSGKLKDKNHFEDRTFSK